MNGEQTSRTLNQVTEGVKLGGQKLRWFLSSIVESHVVIIIVFFFLLLMLPLSLLLFFLVFLLQTCFLCLLITWNIAENYLQTQHHLQFKCSLFSCYNPILQGKYSSEIKHLAQLRLWVDSVFLRSPKEVPGAQYHLESTQPSMSTTSTGAIRDIGGNLKVEFLLGPNSVC